MADPAAEVGKSIDIGEREPARVFADPGDLAHVLDNLIENALRYCPPGTHITVATTTPDSRAALVVLDDGPGIPASERGRVFERFYRGRTVVRSGPGRVSAWPSSPSWSSAGVGRSSCSKGRDSRGGHLRSRDYRSLTVVLPFLKNAVATVEACAR